MWKNVNLAMTWLLLSVSSLANGTEKITENTTANQPLRFFSEIAVPYYFYNPKGKAQGINVDMANALMSELQIDAAVELIPWARAVQETLNKPNRILLSTLRTKAREKQFQWLGSVHQVKASLVAPVTSTHIHINSLNDAKHYRVGTIRGYGSAHFLLTQGFVENVNLVLVSDFERLWQMLNEGRIDMVISNLSADKYELAEIGLQPDNFGVKLSLPQLDLELYVATGPKTDKDTVKKISDALVNIKLQGQLKTILTRWGVE